jgi:hypothetical protein
MLLEHLVPFTDISKGFQAGFMIRNGYMDTIQTTFPHLLKNFPTPIGILKPVNSQHAHAFM